MLIVDPEVTAANFVTTTVLCPAVIAKLIASPAVFYARVDDEQTVYAVKDQLVLKVIVISPFSGKSEVSSTVKVYSK
jgi:hypothetical protein